MNKIYYIFILLLALSACKEGAVDSPTTPSNDGVLLFEKPGKVDSLTRLQYAITPISSGPYASINFYDMPKVRITFNYKATADSLIFSLYKDSSSPLFNFKRKTISTNDSYSVFDTIITKPDTANGTYYKKFNVFYDTCTFVVRDLKIYGVN